MTLEEMAIAAVFIGIPASIALVSRNKHAQNLNSQAKGYIKKVNEKIRQEKEEEVQKQEREKIWQEQLQLMMHPVPSFEYSEQELKFRRDIELIQQVMPLSGDLIPNGTEIDSYQEICQGYINAYNYPWVKSYEAFFNNKNFEDDELKVVSDGIKTQMLLNGNVIITKETIGDFDRVLEVVTLSDCGHKDFKTMFYLNRIIAVYGHNTIVDDSRINPRYGRVDIEEVIHYAEKNVPWRIKNAFTKDSDIEMIDWSGSAKIEVALWDEFNDTDAWSLKTTFHMDSMKNPIGTMWCYASYSEDDFNYYYKKTE